MYFGFHFFQKFNRKRLDNVTSSTKIKISFEILQTKFNKGKSMKKLLGMAVGILSAVGLYAEGVISDLTLETNIQFEAERVFRGRNEFHKAVVPRVKMGCPVCDECSAYIGVDTSVALEGLSALHRVSSHVGVLWDATEMFTLDGGYRHSFFPAMPKAIDNTKVPCNFNEIYGGVIVDVLLEPSLYCFYDFDCKEVAIEGRVSYNVDLAQYVVSGLEIDLGAKVGFDQSSKPYGLPYNIEKSGKKSYSYYGVNADLVYELNSNARAKVGFSYEGNSAEKKSWVNGAIDDGIMPGHRNSLWINASIDCSF